MTEGQNKVEFKMTEFESCSKVNLFLFCDFYGWYFAQSCPGCIQDVSR